MRNFLVSKKGSTMMPRKILIIISRKLQEIAESERRIVKYKKRLSEYANRTRDTLGEANAIPEVIDYSSQYLVFLKEKITNISETDPEELKKNIYMREFLKEADAILKYAPKNLFKDSNRAEKYTAIPTKYESDFCALHASIREIVTLIHRKFGRDILRVEWIESLGLLKSPKQKEEVYSPSPTEARTLFYGERLVGILAQTSTLQEIILSTLKSGK